MIHGRTRFPVAHAICWEKRSAILDVRLGLCLDINRCSLCEVKHWRTLGGGEPSPWVVGTPYLE